MDYQQWNCADNVNARGILTDVADLEMEACCTGDIFLYGTSCTDSLAINLGTISAYSVRTGSYYLAMGKYE